MGFTDLFHSEKGQNALIRLALLLLAIVIAFQFIVCFLAQLSAADGLLVFMFLIAVSPVAYLVREHRRGRPRREPRRGAERVPALPQDHEEDR
jgi:hypothetical protein